MKQRVPNAKRRQRSGRMLTFLASDYKLKKASFISICRLRIHKKLPLYYILIKFHLLLPSCWAVYQENVQTFYLICKQRPLEKSTKHDVYVHPALLRSYHILNWWILFLCWLTDGRRHTFGRSILKEILMIHTGEFSYIRLPYMQHDLFWDPKYF